MCYETVYNSIQVVQTTLKLSFYSHKPHIELDVYYKKKMKNRVTGL